MTENNVTEAFLTIKIKNSEGYDRIPQQVFLDGMSVLLSLLLIMFPENVQQ